VIAMAVMGIGANHFGRRSGWVKASVIHQHRRCRCYRRGFRPAPKRISEKTELMKAAISFYAETTDGWRLGAKKAQYRLLN
jgi:hypothetical protein